MLIYAKKLYIFLLSLVSPVYTSLSPPSFPGLIEKLGVVHLQTWWETTNFVLRPFLGRGGKLGGGDGDRGGRGPCSRMGGAVSCARNQGLNLPPPSGTIPRTKYPLLAGGRVGSS